MNESETQFYLSKPHDKERTGKISLHWTIGLITRSTPVSFKEYDKEPVPCPCFNFTCSSWRPRVYRQFGCTFDGVIIICTLWFLHCIELLNYWLRSVWLYTRGFNCSRSSSGVHGLDLCTQDCVYDVRSSVDDMHHLDNDMQCSDDDMHHLVYDMQCSVDDMHHLVYDMQYSVLDMHHPILALILSTWMKTCTGISSVVLADLTNRRHHHPWCIFSGSVSLQLFKMILNSSTIVSNVRLHLWLHLRCTMHWAHHDTC